MSDKSRSETLNVDLIITCDNTQTFGGRCTICAAESIRELSFASTYNYSQNNCFAIWHYIMIMYHFLFELKDFKLFSMNTYYFYKTLFCCELHLTVSIPLHLTDSGALYLPFIETQTQASAVLSSFHAELSVCVYCTRVVVKLFSLSHSLSISLSLSLSLSIFIFIS